MISEKMKTLVAGSSAIRAMFEDGVRLAQKYGAENVFDFSLGNPNLEPPESVRQAVIDVLAEDSPTLVHGYMDNCGYPDVRQKVAESINRRFGTAFSKDNIVMTVGAAGGLNVIFNTLMNPGDEVITFAPYFGEYKSYAANCHAVLKAVPADTSSFQPNLAELEKMIGPKTRIVLINSPNNPTGVIYSEETIVSLSALLERKQKELGTDIYLVADEPYRELAYDGIEVPYVTRHYKNAIVGYSWSKSLSLPGERIGYLLIPDSVADFEDVRAAVSTAVRIMGFVNAPSLLQRAVAKCLDECADIDFYDKNRKALYEGLTSAGYECVYPQGAFYMFVKTPVDDDKAFCERAKNDFRLLLVPGSAFGCSGYVRIAYCVSPDTIRRSMPAFKALMESYTK
ncbi:MAG: pyridoxal phosphate-dependent aminotransferase [Clostridia bacterium]|nr:pyridoxal phosphate-dependent aminotransferase [Clostridia bacterium]